MRDCLNWEPGPVFVTQPRRRTVVIPFCDDSTLFFALRMRAVLMAADDKVQCELAWYADESALSYRQMSQLLPAGPDRALNRKGLEALTQDTDISAIITSRVFRPLQTALNSQAKRLQGGRPCVIAFLGGLDFRPEAGFAHRRNCDAVYLFPHNAVDLFRSTGTDTAWQEVGFGHPSFLYPAGGPRADHAVDDITFFAQALSPSTRRGRLHMLRALAVIARRNPQRNVWIKLRHLPEENRAHLHREKHDYPGLMAQSGDIPPNLRLTTATMDEVLKTTGLGITCTSTAAIDLLREGLPTMVYLDYVDAYRDALVGPMRKLFQASNLITPLDEMLALCPRPVDPDWLSSMLCPRDLGHRVLETMARFEQRPFQVAPASV